MSAASYLTLAPAARPKAFKLTVLDLTCEPEPLEWVVHKLFTTDSVNLLVAAPGSLKTWTLLSLGLAIASGEPWLNVYATGRPRNVLLVDWESGERRVHHRLRLLTRGQVSEDLLYFRPPCSMQHPEFWPRLRETVETYDVGVVLYDSLAAGSEGVDENTVQAAQPLIKAGEIDGVTHIFIHHAGKSEQKNNAIARGSSAIQAAADTIYRFTDPEGSQATELRCAMLLAKAGDGEQEERIPLRLTDAGGLQLDADVPAAPQATELSTAILDLLRTDGPKNRTEMAKHLRKRPADVAAALRALEADGSIALIDRKYRIDSEELRYGRVLVALAAHVSKRVALGQQAHVKPTDLDSFAAKGMLQRIGGEFYAPTSAPALGFLGLSEKDAAAVRGLFGSEAPLFPTIGQGGV